MHAQKEKMHSSEHKTCPGWLSALIQEGYIPYMMTSRHLLPMLNTQPFGVDVFCSLMEEHDQLSFHEAYFLSNALSFKAPDLKMPSWVLIDCVMMQTAVVGFMRSKHAIPSHLLDYYQNDPHVDLDKIEYIPITGHISSPAVGGTSLTGFSLFSLARELGAGTKQLGLLSKALALEVYKAHAYESFYGVAQYHNPALRIHGRFSSIMEIDQVTVPLHPQKDMSLVYKMKIDFDPYTVETEPMPVAPTFWMNAKDAATKKRIEKEMRAGKRFIIAPPFSVRKGEDTMIPIIEKDA